MENKNRLTVNDSPEIGKLRYETYKGVLSKYKKAMEVGCYLEAITLMESIVFDRLASIVNETQEKQVSKETFFEMIKRASEILKVYENKEAKRDVVIQESLPLDELMKEESTVEKELKELDILNLTPLDALNILYKLIDL